MIAVGKAEQALIRLIYANCPDGYEVDHIMPLSKGGSHGADNLQYLPLSVNRRKNNRLDFDGAEHAITWQSVLDIAFNDHPSGEYGQAAGSTSDPFEDQDMIWPAEKPAAALRRAA